MANGDDQHFARAVSSALRTAPLLPLEPTVVQGCLDPSSALDQSFAAACKAGLKALPGTVHRGRLNGVTGHVGESVAEVLLAEHGYTPLWHFTGPMSGGHGVDLLMLSPMSTVAAVEVKATLVPARWPRPTRRELTQLSPRWLDNDDNPGMATWALRGGDVHGLIIVINFVASAWKCVGTWDFQTVRPARQVQDLTNRAWICGTPT